MPLKINKNIILECRKRCLSLTWYPLKVRERINRYRTYYRLLENFAIEYKENDAVDEYVAEPSADNLLAIEYYHRGEYKKIITLLKREGEAGGANPESFVYYLALLQYSPTKVLTSAYHQQLIPRQSSTSLTLDDGAFWNTLMSMYENRLGIHDKAVVSAASTLRVCPFIFEAWNELGWALSHLVIADGKRSMEVLRDLFIVLQDKGYSEIANLLAMYLRGRWRINCVPPQASSLNIEADDSLYSFYLQLQGLCLCAHRDYEKARQAFEDLLRRRPEHVDGMDTYSDILYLMEDSSQLAVLNSRFSGLINSATASAAIACHIRGNYFCLKGDYAKAAMMFHRAAHSNAYHYAAWILAAQQYLELRSPEAAIDCFLRATEGNAADYRGWFGLGQVYELLGNTQMALLYYHQALCCQQEQIDSARVLMSIADCHIGIGRMERARDALEEALPLLLQSSADVKEMMALAHLRLGVVKSKMGIPGHMEHFHLYLDAHPDLIKPAGSHQEQQQIDDPHVRMALLAIAQDDRLRGDHHRASLMLSLLSTAIGPVHEKDD